MKRWSVSVAIVAIVALAFYAVLRTAERGTDAGWATVAWSAEGSGATAEVLVEVARRDGCVVAVDGVELRALASPQERVAVVRSTTPGTHVLWVEIRCAGEVRDRRALSYTVDGPPVARVPLVQARVGTPWLGAVAAGPGARAVQSAVDSAMAELRAEDAIGEITVPFERWSAWLQETAPPRVAALAARWVPDRDARVQVVMTPESGVTISGVTLDTQEDQLDLVADVELRLAFALELDRGTTLGVPVRWEPPVITLRSQRSRLALDIRSWPAVSVLEVGLLEATCEGVAGRVARDICEAVLPRLRGPLQERAREEINARLSTAAVEMRIGDAVADAWLRWGGALETFETAQAAWAALDARLEVRAVDASGVIVALTADRAAVPSPAIGAPTPRASDGVEATIALSLLDTVGAVFFDGPLTGALDRLAGVPGVPSDALRAAAERIRRGPDADPDIARALDLAGVAYDPSFGIVPRWRIDEAGRPTLWMADITAFRGRDGGGSLLLSVELPFAPVIEDDTVVFRLPGVDAWRHVAVRADSDGDGGGDIALRELASYVTTQLDRAADPNGRPVLFPIVSLDEIVPALPPLPAVVGGAGWRLRIVDIGVADASLVVELANMSAP